MLTELIIGGATYFLTKKLTDKALEGSNELISKAIQMVDYYNTEQYLDAIELADEILESEDAGKLDEEVIKEVNWNLALCYSYGADQVFNNDFSWTDEENEDAFTMLKKGRDLFFDYGNEYGWNDDVVYQIMIIDNQVGRGAFTRNFAIYLIGSENDMYREKAMEIYNEDTEYLLQGSDKFTDTYSYNERKYVFIGQNVKKIGGTYQLFDDEREIDWIFTIDQHPSDMVFPLGRPQSGLYMAHPVKTDHYYPMEGVEDTLFMEKVREFCWLVQCLGATKVSFHSDKGMSVSKGMGVSMDADAQIETKSVTIAGSGGKTSKRSKSYSSRQQVELVQNFAPKKKAYCPNDLIWLDSDPAWQMLIKQRLQGGIMDYTYKISSSETCHISTSEMKSLKANFEYMMVKVNGNYNANTDKTFSSNKETEWSIHVEFAPLEELKEEDERTSKKPSKHNKARSQKKLAETEQEYLDTVKECLEDGEIGSRERKLLDKIRVKNGISEERAKELESTLIARQLTDDEKEYLEAYKDACEDGKVSDKHRRLLEKLRVMYGISEERARELEE